MCMTEFDVTKMLAIQQIEHYQSIKQASSASGDKQEYCRSIDQIDMLVTEYGLKQNGSGVYE